MAKNLVIVESPAKAKTIEKFLGADYKVESSYGHIRDLESKDLSIDVDNGYTPKYTIPADKKEIVKKLQKLTKESETVWLASDEDREGEAIAWHLAEALKLDVKKTKRIVFHEITKTAIQKAIANPRTVDLNLVNAQQARRILDRLVGFELSPVLWRKVRQGLSAGRVQSVSVRLIVDREREIQNFTSTYSYRVTALFTNSEGKSFKAELNHRFDTFEQAKEFINGVGQTNYKITSLEQKPATKSPTAPFTTSTLQQEASRKLGFSVSQTMSVAQRLYEAGLITYMRTDSVNLSEDAMANIKGEIVNLYGTDFHKQRKYTSKAKGAQEAHEAIRPTYMNNHDAGADGQQKRLYELIWKRTIASQMADAKLERTTARINSPMPAHEFIAKGEIITFEGFLKVYMEDTDDDELEEQEGMLPKLSKNEVCNPVEVSAVQRFTKHPPRYTEASLVKKLEELGIGRPSTYAPTISTIIRREYVHKPELEGQKRAFSKIDWKEGKVQEQQLTENTGAEKGKLMPTDIGIVVNDFLVNYFDKILDFNFTASVEEEFDKIAEGELEWVSMIDKFYKEFHPTINETLEKADRVKGERLLGEDPESKKNVYAKIGRYGPMIQIGENTDEEKPKFASLLKGQSIDTIEIKDALKLFDLPRTVGEYQGKEVIAAIGRFGPYLKFGSLFVSINSKNGDDPLSIEIERAGELIEAKIKADKEKFIAKFDEDKPVIEVLNGRWGPYIKVGKSNYKIPKEVEAKTLTRQDCEKIIGESDTAPAKKTTATTKAAADKKETPVKKVAAKKAPAKKAPAKKSPAKKTTKK